MAKRSLEAEESEALSQQKRQAPQEPETEDNTKSDRPILKRAKALEPQESHSLSPTTSPDLTPRSKPEVPPKPRSLQGTPTPVHPASRQPQVRLRMSSSRAQSVYTYIQVLRIWNMPRWYNVMTGLWL